MSKASSAVGVSKYTQTEELSPELKQFAQEYGKYVLVVFPNLDPEWTKMLGHIMANKLQYGVVYPDKIEQVLKHINDYIRKL